MVLVPILCPVMGISTNIGLSKRLFFISVRKIAERSKYR
jgi:hypothetical protein